MRRHLIVEILPSISQGTLEKSMHEYFDLVALFSLSLSLSDTHRTICSSTLIQHNFSGKKEPVFNLEILNYQLIYLLVQVMSAMKTSSRLNFSPKQSKY